MKKDGYVRLRKKMVETQLVERGIKDPGVLKAMETVKRHLFMDEAIISQAYSDFPLPIGEGQTISQPFMVAYMTEALNLTGEEKVLESGTGSGLHSAILFLLCRRVFSIQPGHSLAIK